MIRTTRVARGWRGKRGYRRWRRDDGGVSRQAPNRHRPCRDARGRMWPVRDSVDDNEISSWRRANSTPRQKTPAK